MFADMTGTYPPVGKDRRGGHEIIFLFNHDAGHQAAHLAGIAGETARMGKAYRVTIAFGSDTTRREVMKLLSREQIDALQWQSLALPKALQYLTSGLNRLIPVHRLMRLYYHRLRLRKAVAIVSTERTCLTLKRYWSRHFGKATQPIFVYVPHGSGDRNVAVHPALKEFDLSLVSGQKVQDQLLEAGVATADQIRITGYAKFDILKGRTPERFFDNDRPTFLYNPHFDPYMSSWFDQGPDILELFFQNADHFNLIFAPHAMLFYKKIHISPEYKLTRIRPDVAPRYANAANIRIDTDSERLFDMSYTLSADAYIGDVSSQVYEFLYRPRACFFIDVHSAQSSDTSPAYDFWNNGPVVRNAAQLAPMLPRYADIAARYHAAQVQRMTYTADRSDPRPASVRGAEALITYVGNRDITKD
jgi:hypothetical protein